MEVRKKPITQPMPLPISGLRSRPRDADSEAPTLRIPRLPPPPAEFTQMKPLDEVRSTCETRPEIPSLKCIAPPNPLLRRGGSTLPSPGMDFEENDRMALVIRDIGRLSSVRRHVAERAAVSLISQIWDSAKARDVLGLLPPTETPCVARVRFHCLDMLQNELRKTPMPGQKD